MCDKSCRGNELIAEMNYNGVSKCESYMNELAINSILFNDYGMKYINIYCIFLELVKNLVLVSLQTKNNNTKKVYLYLVP